MRYIIRLARLSFCGVAVLVVCPMLAAAVFAQQKPATTSVPANPTGPFTEAMERRNREMDLRSITMMAKDKPADPRINRALLEQMNDDFKQIQVIRLGMLKNIADGKPFEYKHLAEDAAEIKRRSTRLRSSLALFEEQESERQDLKKVEYQKDTIQDAASNLCLEISRFTTNPMFAPGSVYSARYAAEADQALDKVINLSTDIKNSADKLRRDE